ERVVVLMDARTPTERRLIAEWARSAHATGELIATGDPALEARLAARDDARVVPVRVTWLPREREGDRRVRTADLLALMNPHRPWAPVQPRIVRHDIDRARVTAGEPASSGELRTRFEREVGGVHGANAFAAFVSRQAMLALERAERAVIGDRYKVPRLVAEQIAESADFRARLAALAERLERPPDEVLSEAVDDLHELAAVQSRLAIDVFRTVMGPLHKHAWTVDVDTSRLDELRELGRRHALVFLPSHRSYADPLVLAQALDAHEFPRNHVVGGGNMSFWPIGPLGKRAGLVFIRRSFGDDPVYKFAVREYFGYLVAKRFNLEWYIEGGRSRTGKLRPPRFGLLHYLVAALDDGRAENVYLVPTSITYEQLEEVGAMAAEQSGARKQAEGLRWLAGYAKAQRRNVGSARVRFGEPISLRDALEVAGPGSAQLEKVAFTICDGINRTTPVTASSLVTFTLLGVRDRALTLDQVTRVTAPLLAYFESRGIAGPLSGLARPGGIKRALDALVRAEVVSCYGEGTEPVWSIKPGRHHVAAFYRNGAVHHLVNRAIVELAIVGLPEAPPGEELVEAAAEDALRLRDLLKFEFFFADKPRFREQLAEELDLLDPRWRQRADTVEGARSLLAGAGTLVAHRALRSFFDAQLVVARRLAAREPRHAIDRDAFIKECLGVGRQMLLQGDLHGAESVSAELYASAIKLAANRDLTDPGREPVRVAREQFLAEISSTVARVARVGELESSKVEEVILAGVAR
ncbi:MAG TPA: glycerol-3-phosphate 1-O-acyltransferase, partial [Solirubrobacteraceae bacterium]|nr:glycerol-3-phosphate 1-O-acyltransferase [Solirubrobacteraceae bacterium]